MVLRDSRPVVVPVAPAHADERRLHVRQEAAAKATCLALLFGSLQLGLRLLERFGGGLLVGARRFEPLGGVR